MKGAGLVALKLLITLSLLSINVIDGRRRVKKRLLSNPYNFKDTQPALDHSQVSNDPKIFWPLNEPSNQAVPGRPKGFWSQSSNGGQAAQSYRFLNPFSLFRWLLSLLLNFLCVFERESFQHCQFPKLPLCWDFRGWGDLLHSIPMHLKGMAIFGIPSSTTLATFGFNLKSYFLSTQNLYQLLLFYPVKIYLNSGRKFRWKLCGRFWDLLHFYGTLWLRDHAEWDLFLQVWAPLASSRDITSSDDICSPENIPTVCSLMISPMSEDICQVATLRLSKICVANYDLATV